jgi:hypothetical protein
VVVLTSGDSDRRFIFTSTPSNSKLQALLAKGSWTDGKFCGANIRKEVGRVLDDEILELVGFVSSFCPVRCRSTATVDHSAALRRSLCIHILNVTLTSGESLWRAQQLRDIGQSPLETALLGS